MSECITKAEFRRLLERVASKCDEEGGCLIWRGAVSDGGVPRMHFRGRTCSVRRVLHEGATGAPLAPDLVAAPRCRHPQCVALGCIMAVRVRALRQLDAQRGVFSSPAANAARALAARRRAVIPDAVVEQVRAHVGTCAQAAQAVGGISVQYAKDIRAGRARKPLSGNVWGGLLR